MIGNLTVEAFLSVFDGELKIGKKENLGRHSDALVYFVFGEVEYGFDGQTLVARGGSVIHLPKASRYRMNILSPSKFICIDFDFEKAEQVRAASVYQSVPQSLKSDFEKLLPRSLSSEPWAKSECFGMLYSVISSLVRHKNKSYRKSSGVLTLAESFIHQNYKNPELSVSAVAEASGVSVSHLRRLFLEKHALPPVKFITALRIERSKQLLLSSNLGIARIAALSGFTDYSAFYKAYIKKFGVPPSHTLRGV